MATARQPALRGASRGAEAFERIIADFGFALRFPGARILDLGPGQWDFADAARDRGAQRVVGIDNDPAVIRLGEHRGFDAIEKSLQQISSDDFEEPFDGIFCRWSINAFWFSSDDERHARFVRQLCASLAEAGWAWIAPWNHCDPKLGLDDARREQILQLQTATFAEAGFEGFDVTEEHVHRYDLGGSVLENRAVFVRNVDIPEPLRRSRRLTPTGRQQSAPADPADDDPSPRRTTLRLVDGRLSLLSFEYYKGFVDLLHRHPEVFNVITYDDLCWGDDFDHRSGYPDEWSRWSDYVKDEGTDKIHVLIQHDVDASPTHTNAMVAYERSVSVPSNVMIFARLHNRATLVQDGRIVFDPYDIDLELLEAAEREGFVVAYHANCVEQARWDLAKAAERFTEDVVALRQRFAIRYFSPHGGVPGPDDENNTWIEVPRALEGSIRWVHNRFSPRFDAYYSDGGLLSPKRDPAERDLRDFVRTWVPGRRYRVLTHPQYYASPPIRQPYLNQAQWYSELMDAFEEGRTDYWSDVFPRAVSAA